MKYITLARKAEIEILVINSRFIANGEVRTVEEAESFLARIRKRYPLNAFLMMVNCLVQQANLFSRY